MKRDVGLVVAIARNGVIGRGGQLPWTYPEDRARYEAITLGHVVIMGRRTWDEQGAPLEGRTNVVVSRSIASLPPSVHVAKTLDDALAWAWERDACPFVIGGVRLFEEALPQITRIFLTEIPGEPEGDTVFRLDETGFREVRRERGGGGLVFRELERYG